MGLEDAIKHVFDHMQNLMVGIGVAAVVLGIVVGGLLRIFAFGSERRIAAANIALSCAVIGFIIVMLGNVAGNWLHDMFTGIQTTR